MYSLDINIQTALDRKAELVRAVQSVNLTKEYEPVVQRPPARLSAKIRAIVMTLGLGWLVR
jgi:hypothetical protein